MKSKTPFFKDDLYLNLRDSLLNGSVVMASDELCEQAGFRVDVVYSKACFERHVRWPGEPIFQDETGRAWDVLMLSAIALHSNVNEAGQATTGIISVPPHGDQPEHDELRVSWLGDEDDEPVVLVMLAMETVRGINQVGGSK